MKKYMVLCAGLCAAMALTSCKSSESAYKKAYEKAKAQETEQSANQPIQSDSTPVVTPLQAKSADQTTVLDNADNASVRKENVTVISGQGLKSFQCCSRFFFFESKCGRTSEYIEECWLSSSDRL
jgi:outer membrane lipoprotein SlyB